MKKRDLRREKKRRKKLCLIKRKNIGGCGSIQKEKD